MGTDWLDEIVEKMAGDLGPAGHQEVQINRLAGRALAQDIIAPFDLPSSNLSLMDGYAVRREDIEMATAEAPVALGLVGFLKAGDSPRAPLEKGQCLMVATGAGLPLFSDAVVLEESAEERNGEVFFRGPAGAWQFVNKRASTLKAGQKVAAQGDIIGAEEVTMLASLGMKCARVFSTPRVSIIATGDELVMPGEEIRGGQIYASNLFLLAALSEDCGAEVASLVVAGDDADAIAQKLSAAQGGDLIITTGGTSSGRYDLILKTFEAVGAQVLVSGLKAKPCDKFRAARFGGKPLFSLPGRPEAAQVNFGLFIRPVIKKIAGISNYKHNKVNAIYNGSDIKCRELERFLSAKCWVERGDLLARLKDDPCGSGDRSVAGWEAVLVCPGSSPLITKGSEVELIIIG